MRWDHFSGSLVFAAIASLFLPLAQGLIAPLIGSGHAVALLFIAIGWLYGLGGRFQGRGFVGYGLAALGAMVATAALPPLPLYGIAASTLLIALMRSGVAIPVWTPRRILLESAIAGVSLTWVHALLSPRPLAMGMAVWGYFLIQSAHPLCRDWVERRRGRRGVDPFDRARARLLSILDEGG